MKLKEDCFALYKVGDSEPNCSALTQINCEKCKFYRNDIKRGKIEKDIRRYMSFSRKI